MATVLAGLYRLHPDDNVATALADCPPGPTPLLGVEGGGMLELTQPVAQGHKAALAPIKQGQVVVKYGHSIGQALSDIALGDWVGETNLVSSIGLVKGGNAFRPGSKTTYALPAHPRQKGGDSHD